MSVNAMKLEFFRLELDGLIERQPGSWDGFKPRTFIRPTPLAISFMNPRPTDYAKLGQSRQSKSSPTGHPKASPEKPPKGQPNGEPHITSFPSNPPNPTDLFSHAHAHTGGKGKAGEDEKIKKKKLILKKPIPKTPIPPPTDDDEAAFEAMKVKSLEKWLAVFPRIEGDHGVWHPADQHAAWTGWSFELKKERYAVYVAYVTKALKSKSAKKAKGKSGDGDSGFYTGKKPGGLFGLLKKT
ncbi:hypothetical protein ABGN05_00020 [Aquibium sp. LZ166]|uniref:Uncharacterized protein n=1 Tax=Aquibium pacificus TaxID=3153579 RepID=A0ABV3SBB7_9HYPH